MTEKNFDSSDYKKLNGIDWLGKPLGWKSLGFQTLTITGLACLVYFGFSSKNSSQTMYELYGMKYAIIIIPLVLWFIIFLYKGLKDVNEDYVNGKKIVFIATIASFNKRNFGFETTVILKEDFFGKGPLKVYSKNVHAAIKSDSKYEFEVAPNSRTILSMIEI